MKRSAPLKRGTQLKRTGQLKRRRQRETPAARNAREHFNAIVTAGPDRPCFFADHTEAGEPRRPGHVCAGPHHLVQKQWIKRYFGDLPTDELLAILFAPLLGAPLCRHGAHDPVTRRTAYIYFEELDPDLIDMCERLDRRYAADWRPSLLARLEIECPKREAAGSAVSGRSTP